MILWPVIPAGVARADQAVCDNPTVTAPAPASQTACARAAAVQFDVTATGSPDPSYQWRRGTTDLIDGPKYAGSRTPTLTVKNVNSGDIGNNYNCVVTNDCGTATSEMGSLSVIINPFADFNHDCEVDASDLDVFLGCLTASGPKVPAPAECQAWPIDTDHDGDVDLQDYGYFQELLGAPHELASPARQDIVFVLDLSGSMNNYTSLCEIQSMQIMSRPIWTYLWDTSLSPQPQQDGKLLGPTFGYMDTWGDETSGPNGINLNDPGLIYLPYGQNWSLTKEWVSRNLSAHGYGTYTDLEMQCINSKTRDSSVTGQYERRVMVALGLVRWRSGFVGGQLGGNKNTTIDSSEVTEVFVPYPSAASNPETNCKQVGGSWFDYVDYVKSTVMYGGDSNCRYRFGLKTWVDYLLKDQMGDALSPGLNGSPEEPIRTMVDEAKACISILEDMQGDDAIGLASFGSVGYGPQDKPANMSWLTTDHDSITGKLGMLQAGMWSGTTNIAQAIDKGVNVLLGTGARVSASRVLILMTDGMPNMSRAGTDNAAQAETDALQAARDAAALGVHLYVLNVNTLAGDTIQPWLDELAAAGRGSSVQMSSDPVTYRAQLQTLLQEMSASPPDPLTAIRILRCGRCRLLACLPQGFTLTVNHHEAIRLRW